MTTKKKDEVIEDITYISGRQSVARRKTYKYNDMVVKLTVYSDSFDFQSYARAEVLRDKKWETIYSIPYSLMETPISLAYRKEFNNKEIAKMSGYFFDTDINKLETMVKTII